MFRPIGGNKRGVCRVLAVLSWCSENVRVVYVFLYSMFNSIGKDSQYAFLERFE